jgi:hypothetical protein
MLRLWSRRASSIDGRCLDAQDPRGRGEGCEVSAWQLSAVRLAGDINAAVTDDASLDELLVKIKAELVKLGPLIDLDAIREQQGVENRLPVIANGSEAG